VPVTMLSCLRRPRALACKVLLAVAIVALRTARRYRPGAC